MRARRELDVAAFTQEGELAFDDAMVTYFFKKVAHAFVGLNATQAYGLAAQRIDETMNHYKQQPGMPKIQCRSTACFACCLTQKEVDSSPFEVTRILDLLEREDRLEDVVKRAERVAARPNGGACPLLNQEGRCTVYKIRPLSCRIHHSLDRDGCHEPGGSFRQNNQIRTLLALIGVAGMHGLERLTSGRGGLRFLLFEQLAKLGRARLDKQEAA